jgi:hypothetical protein
MPFRRASPHAIRVAPAALVLAMAAESVRRFGGGVKLLF